MLGHQKDNFNDGSYGGDHNGGGNLDPSSAEAYQHPSGLGVGLQNQINRNPQNQDSQGLSTGSRPVNLHQPYRGGSAASAGPSGSQSDQGVGSRNGTDRGARADEQSGSTSNRRLAHSNAANSGVRDLQAKQQITGPMGSLNSGPNQARRQQNMKHGKQLSTYDQQMHLGQYDQAQFISGNDLNAARGGQAAGSGQNMNTRSPISHEAWQGISNAAATGSGASLVSQQKHQASKPGGALSSNNGAQFGSMNNAGQNGGNYGSNISSSTQNSKSSQKNQQQNKQIINKKGSLTYRNKTNNNKSGSSSHQSQLQPNSYIHGAQNQRQGHGNWPGLAGRNMANSRERLGLQGVNTQAPALDDDINKPDMMALNPSKLMPAPSPSNHYAINPKDLDLHQQNSQPSNTQQYRYSNLGSQHLESGSSHQSHLSSSVVQSNYSASSRGQGVFRANLGAGGPHATLVAGNSRFNNNSMTGGPGKNQSMGGQALNKIRLSPRNQWPGAGVGTGGQSSTSGHKSFNLAQNQRSKKKATLQQRDGGSSFNQPSVNAFGAQHDNQTRWQNFDHLPQDNFMEMEIEVGIDDKHQLQNPPRETPSAAEREAQRRQMMLQSQQSDLEIMDLLQGLYAYHKLRMNKRASPNKQDEQMNFDGVSKLVPIEQLAQATSAGVLDDQRILECPLNLSNQRVIKADAERTRVVEIRSVLEEHSSVLQSDVVDADLSQLIPNIEKTLTFYTKVSNTTYKQGYNELWGPFLWLAYLNRKNYQTQQMGNQTMPQQTSPIEKHAEAGKLLVESPLSLSYAALDLFIKNFVPTLFLDDDFICLQSCFCLLRLLLKYHDPEICYILSSAGVTPELYATSWFFTYFANKCDHLDVICELWHRIIIGQDNKFIFALSIALIVYNRGSILSSEKSDLPTCMAGLSIQTMEQLDAIMDIAQDIYERTPVSYWQSDEMNILFGENASEHFRNMNRDQKVEMHLRLEQMQCLPISIAEFFENIYPDHIPCPNPKCFKFNQIQSILKTEWNQSQKSQISTTSSNIEQTNQFNPQKDKPVLANQGILIDYKAVPEHTLDLRPRNTETTDLQDSSYPQRRSELQPQSTPEARDYPNPNASGPFDQQHPPVPSDHTGQFQPTNPGKSPSFKTMVKQQPIEADASVVQMETETNVKDDDTDNSPLQKQTNNFQLLQQDYDRQSAFQQRPMGQRQAKNGGASTAGSVSLSRYYMNEGVDVANLDANTRFPDGPTNAELCEDCRANRISMDSEKYRNSIRLVIMDCRASMLQKEAMLPRSAKFDIENNCDKKNLLAQVRQLIEGCKDQAHICLVGLSEQEVPKDYNQAQEQFGFFGQSPMSNKQVQSSTDGSFNIKEFHERILKCIIEMFYKEKFMYISCLSGGFEACHSFIEQYNNRILQARISSAGGDAALQMAGPDGLRPQFMELVDPHDPDNCYHCSSKTQDQFPENAHSPSQLDLASVSSANTRMTSPKDTGVSGHGAARGGHRDYQNYGQSEANASSQNSESTYQMIEKEYVNLGSIQNHGQSQRYQQSQGMVNQKQDRLYLDQTKYDQKRFNISSNGAGYQNSQYNQHHQNSEQSEAFDIFSGFRHWWQDNVTNNQRLKGFGLSEADSQPGHGSQRAVGMQGANDQQDGLVFRDANGQTFQLMNVTQQTRNNIKNRQLQKEREHAVQHQQTAGGPQGFNSFFQSDQSQDNRDAVHFSKSMNPQFPQQMVSNSRFAERHSDLQNQQNNHRFARNPLEMRTQQMVNAGASNRGSANRTVQTGGYQGFREINQHHNLSPSPRGRAKNGPHSQYPCDAKNAMLNYDHGQAPGGGPNDFHDQEDDVLVDMDRDQGEQHQLQPPGHQNQMSPDMKHAGGMGMLAHKSLMRPATGPAGGHMNNFNLDGAENYDYANPQKAIDVNYQELYYNNANRDENDLHLMQQQTQQQNLMAEQNQYQQQRSWGANQEPKHMGQMSSQVSARSGRDHGAVEGNLEGDSDSQDRQKDLRKRSQPQIGMQGKSIGSQDLGDAGSRSPNPMVKKSPRNHNFNDDVGEPDQDFQATANGGQLADGEDERTGDLAANTEKQGALGKAHDEQYWSKANNGDPNDFKQGISAPQLQDINDQMRERDTVKYENLHNAPQNQNLSEAPQLHLDSASLGDRGGESRSLLDQAAGSEQAQRHAQKTESSAQHVLAAASSNNGQQNTSTSGNPASTSTPTSQAAQQFQLEERSYYLCNGIQKQQSYLNCQDKVQKIVEVDAPLNPIDIVIYHVKRLASSPLQQAIQSQQMTPPQLPQSQDLQAGHQPSQPNQESRIFGHTTRGPGVTSIVITQFTTICLCQAFSSIQSRFFMHDLIKITSRKSSAKIITFYFRIPQFGEYNQNYFTALEAQSDPTVTTEEAENVILDSYNQNPIVPYQFAYKRKKYQEVKMGFEFKNEEEARDCIERVSILYKRLKNSFKS